VNPQPWKAWLVSAAIAASLSLAGCGPGVGGTGTGGAALTAFGATAASVCGSAFALELGCAQAPAPAPSGAIGSSMGTLPVQFVDASGRITLDLDGNAATLLSSCLKLRFDGDFSHAASGDAFFGTVHVDASNGDALASLIAAPASGGGLTVELRDVDGKMLLGPVVLQRAVVPVPAPSGC
jgi:hypothetical protein